MITVAILLLFLVVFVGWDSAGPDRRQEPVRLPSEDPAFFKKSDRDGGHLPGQAP